MLLGAPGTCEPKRGGGRSGCSPPWIVPTPMNPDRVTTVSQAHRLKHVFKIHLCDMAQPGANMCPGRPGLD
jgi:hypothetical protein